MARRPHQNDICIGKDAWIAFGDLADGQSRAVEIDPHLAPVLPFIESLETACVAECCGIDAFLLLREEIQGAAASNARRELDEWLAKFTAVAKLIGALPCDTVVSTRMNQYFRKSVFLEVLAHIRRTIAGVR